MSCLSTVIYRWQQATKGTLFEKILTLMNFAYTLLVLNYSAVGFMVSSLFFRKNLARVQTKRYNLTIGFLAHVLQVLSLHETLTSYGSVYYIGTVIPIVLILLGKVIKPARPTRSKASKEE